ncbi:JAB domain-containing protein [Sediminibacterium roseum]|uniref:JAB domain-containing protein n=1 Tax=Sediminibacterium roseum TaxID=1978412 RepID=A0ABX0A2T1_9BACT|nr:DNA repair protein RadC [Sediminibacterium roseum]NCI51515.1 JAB domain-containing protein [Sediminibacterium roseum]
MNKFSIKQWADDDQPRKKMLLKGAEALSDSELIAILINAGTPSRSAVQVAKELLLTVGNDLRKLTSMSVQEIVNKKVKGLGEAKAINIAAALELGIRRSTSASRASHVTRSADIAHFLRAHLEYRQQEVFAVVFLNRGNKITHTEIISEGGITGTVADPRIILKKALEHNATALVLCHNHPSGNTKPSRADEVITQKIKQAASLLDITIMDHIIVSKEGYFSFADEGML